MAASNPAIVTGIYGGDNDPSKRFSGSDPDPRHLEGGGYHPSVNQLIAHGNGDDYSHQHPLDMGGDPNRSSGLDTSRSTANMIVRTQRAITAIRIDHPLFRSCREVNGTLDGVTTVNSDRFLGGGQNYHPDATHLWHSHYGWLRWYMTDPTRSWQEVPRVLAVLNGTPLGDITIEPPDKTQLQEEDDMPELNITLQPGEMRTVKVPRGANSCTFSTVEEDGRVRVEAMGGTAPAQFLGGSRDENQAQLIPKRKPFGWIGNGTDGTPKFSAEKFAILRLKNFGRYQVAVEMVKV